MYYDVCYLHNNIPLKKDQIRFNLKYITISLHNKLINKNSNTKTITEDVINL